VSLNNQGRHSLVLVLAGIFFLVMSYFVYRSFYGMRITASLEDDEVLLEPGEAGPGSGAAVTGAGAAAGLVQTGAGEQR